MDGGFRVQRPAERQPASRPEAQRQSAAEEPKSTRVATGHHMTQEKKPKKRFVVPIIIVVAVVVLAVGGWFAWSKMQSSNSGIDSSKYQAVFFTNGQVYFGKLTGLNDDQMKLTDVFYLQTQASENSEKDSKNPQDSSTDQSSVQLIKLGNEVHGPEDAMVISRDQVLFYENLKNDGKVATTIKQYKEQK